jgi:hypothetical protein
MATVRQYFDTDFPHTVRICCRLPLADENIETRINQDFSSFATFVSFYIPDKDRPLSFYATLIKNIQYASTKLTAESTGNILLPSSWDFPGELQIGNFSELTVRCRFHGTPRWISGSEMPMSRRIFIYSESDLTDDEILKLHAEGRELGHDVEFRSQRHANFRAQSEKPVAFISHDSRDADIARRIAIGLQKARCSVWYDEFTLRVGDNLRDSIEKGLKECHKCIVVLSRNFFSNKGWTKKEFDSIFTREILEETNLVLPIWFEVDRTEVYDYSPSLLNVKGLDWARLGEDEVVRQLHRSISARVGSDGWFTSDWFTR